MKDRKEFEEELEHVSKKFWTDNGKEESRFARNRLLEWFDANARSLGENGALRASLTLAIKGKVEAEIRVQELEQKLEHAERALRNVIREEDEDE